jgi:hypothetical protein
VDNKTNSNIINQSQRRKVMRGIQAETIPYTLECDLGLPKEQRTTWHIRIQTIIDDSKSAHRLNKAFIMKNNQTEIDERQYLRAQKGKWEDVIKKVENYEFGYKFPDLQAKGRIAEIEDADTIIKIAYDIPTELRNELLKIADGGTALDTELGDVDPKK